MSELKLKISEYRELPIRKLAIYFFTGFSLLAIILFWDFVLFLIVFFIFIVAILVLLKKKDREEKIVFKDMNNKETIFAEIKEFPFIGSYINNMTVINWNNVNSVSIKLYQPLPMHYFLTIIKDNNVLLRSQFNRNIEYLGSDGRVYWESVHKICLEKSLEFGFKFEVTELFDYILNIKKIKTLK